MAYEQHHVDLHAYVWVRFDGPVEDEDNDATPTLETSPEGIVTEIYPSRRIRKGCPRPSDFAQYIRTTPGRIIYNKTIQDSLAS